MSGRLSIILILVILSFISAVPRFYDLGSLGFYGDEETTSLPSRSLAIGEGSYMPSGMEYLRALPQTFLNAISARIFGLDRELSYRIPSALIGTLTVPVFFLLSYLLFGWRIALVASLLLALSEWHILLSRTARMYGPFLFFYMASGLTLWQWIQTRSKKYLVFSIILFYITISIHLLGLLAIFFLLIPLCFKHWSKVSSNLLVFISLIFGITAYLYDRFYVTEAFRSFKNINGTVLLDKLDSSGLEISWFSLIAEKLTLLNIALLISGILCGLWLARQSYYIDNSPDTRYRLLTRYVAAVFFGSLAFSGNIYGAFLFLLILFLIHPLDGSRLLNNIKYPFGLIVLVAAVNFLIAIKSLGFISALKASVLIPFPYLIVFGQEFPLVILLFVGMGLYLAWKSHSEDEFFLRACLLAAILPIMAIGFARGWGGMRFLAGSYPFLLLVSAAGLLTILGFVCRYLFKDNKYLAVILSSILVFSGLLGGHGIPQAINAATLNYGDRFVFHSYGYPDHKGSGEYVRKNLKPGDIVVAEDVIQQSWYVGQVDYWLRDHESHSKFLYKDEDGKIKDIYTSSEILSESNLNLISNINQRVWIITSGETYTGRGYYLNKNQLAWLEKIENEVKPVYKGRDRVSNVYLIN